MLYFLLVQLLLDPISVLVELVEIVMQVGILVDNLIDLLNKLPKLLVIEDRFNFSNPPQVVLEIEVKPLVLKLKLILYRLLPLRYSMSFLPVHRPYNCLEIAYLSEVDFAIYTLHGSLS